MTTKAVYGAIAKVMREIAKEGIAKTRDNQQTRSKFRGIDDVYNALCGPLADAGLVILPTVVEHNQVERESKAGGALYCSTVVVDYVFVAVEDGSCHTARVIGEAMDSSDKSFSKAMSFAFKYVCFQAFCIPTEGDNDADAHRPEAKPRSQQPPQTRPPEQQRRAEEQPKSEPAKPLPTRTSENYPVEQYAGVPFSSMPATALTAYVKHYQDKLPELQNEHHAYAAKRSVLAAQKELEARRAEEMKSGAAGAA